MKPNRFILFRHTESIGNIIPEMYYSRPNYTHDITSHGMELAVDAANQLKIIIRGESIQVYLSTMWRARATFEILYKLLEKDATSVKFHEDPRLRPQEWGGYRTAEQDEKLLKQREDYGPFYFTVPGGESGANVYDRIASFGETLYRHFQDENYADNVLIVTHGMPYRLLLMYFLGWSVEEFESYENPANCQFSVLTRGDNGTYTLDKPLNKRQTVYKHRKELKLD